MVRLDIAIERVADMAEPTSHPRDVVAGDCGQVRRRTAPAAVLAKAAGIAALSGLATAAGCGQGRTLLEPSPLSAGPSGARRSSALSGAVGLLVPVLV